MKMVPITPEEISVVKKVLFGLQKQSSVQNDVVCLIVAKELSAKIGHDVLADSDSLIEGIKLYIQKCIDHEIEPDSDAFMLLCGEKSYNYLSEFGPRVVDVSQPSLDSPKLLFRVAFIGETPDVNRSVLYSSAEMQSSVSKSNSDVLDKKVDSGNSFAKRAEMLKSSILPLVPDAVKAEIPDNEYAQALCCAEYYYRNMF